MIARPSIAFDAFAGTAKDVTARKVGGRTVLSVRAKQPPTVTPAQAISRNRLSTISRSYKTLPAEEMDRWIQLAKNYNASSSLGKGATLTGHNLFVRLNSNLVMVGSAARTTAPVGLDNVPPVQIGAMYVNSSAVLIENVNEVDDDLKMVVKMSDAQSVGVSSAWSKTVVVSSSEETDWGELDLTEAFADILGEVVDGQKYFVEIYWIDSETGFPGPVIQFSGIAGPDSIYGQSSGSSSRSIIRVKDYETSDRCYYKDFEYELSHGSVISTVKGIYGYKGTRSNSYVELAPDAESKFEPAKGYYLGRGNYGSQWKIGILEVETRETSDKFRLGVTPRYDDQSYGAEFFDTGTPILF